MKNELTKRDMKIIIDYLRFEARLSYSLKRIQWLTEETLRIKNEALGLAEKFARVKRLLRKIDKGIFDMITKEDEIETKWHGIRLK